MSNYAHDLPKDKSGNAMQHYPAPKLALAQFNNENNTTSSVISLTHDTTSIEIAPVGVGAVMRWVATTDTAASVVSASGGDFDHAIPADTVRRFVVPRESAGANNLASVQGINREEGLYQRVAIKSYVIASVLTTEY